MTFFYRKKKSDRRRMRRISNQKHNKKIIIFKSTPKLSHRHKRSSNRVVNINFSQIDLDNSGFELSRSYVYVIQTQLSGHVYVKLLTQVNYILRRLQSKSDFIRYEFHIQGYLQCKRNEKKKNEDGRYNFSTYLSNFLLRTSLRRPQCLSMISIAFPVESIFSCE